MPSILNTQLGYSGSHHYMSKRINADATETFMMAAYKMQRSYRGKVEVNSVPSSAMGDRQMLPRQTKRTDFFAPFSAITKS